MAKLFANSTACLYLENMKKLIFLGLSALALAGCPSTISNPNQLIGQWQCTIEYDDFNIRTVDNLRFSTNGTMTNQGGIYYPIQKSIFEYSLQQNGRWSVKNGAIVYRIVSESVQRSHRSQIWSELQRDAELQQFEENLFSSLSDSDNNKTVELIITDFDEKEMDIKQEIKGHKAYKGQCIKQ
ncbi:TPA: hypothetical protein PWY45_000045 [Mannheimia haemolytica]|uniref:hypothetical protein n=2 Tax=Mannheimia haemolytica TaxID=75985 RepID=UPI00035840CB|nr:hypothetical protein [Mannheimia haemolytica]AGQ38229.1 hypothetical protein J450_03425 [Mannheimia haemolytica D171]MDW0545740.1 hypothetical protein [Mannheimia haemolytica]MDW0592483.1 hypothetical protein [Mannheimia haemolytica]MDW0655326.1 hypothetical protein [Mannheimia haemolytica]MDW0984404.1 hypothetical protein [Mannheimia haemolytica]